jgi:hypothetical protein
MIHFSGWTSSFQLRVATLSGLVAGFVLVSSASALDLDFNVASGNYTVPSNWLDTTNPMPVAASAAPTVNDSAYVRNNGTVTINSNVEASRLWIGYTLVITNPDYDLSTVVDAGDYVLWRKGGPFPTPPTGTPNPDVVTPGSVTQEDYDYWRFRYGATPISENLGQAGTLNWTDGEITGPASTGLNLGGTDIRVGRIQFVNGVVVEVPGTVVQNGPNTKVLLPYGDTSGNMTTGHGSVLTIGDAGGAVNGVSPFSHNPLSSYTLMAGTIGVGVSSSNVSNSSGTNGNNGINVRNGTFTMTGGNIIDATQSIFNDATHLPTAQRFLTVANQAGGGEGNEAVSTANLSGGNINVLGGIRVALQNNTRGYLNISGNINIITGGDTSIGYQPTNSGSQNAVGEMNMSSGTFQVGRTDTNPATGVPFALAGRFQIGDRGKGILNMSGGTINVTRNVVVGNEGAYNIDGVHPATLGSIINLTGGTITTGGLEMRRNAASFPDPVLPDVNGVPQYSASIIVNGPNASFITTGTGQSPATVIGNNGKALFEVRQGTAVLGANGQGVQVGNSAATDATINVKGGKLTLGGPVSRSNAGSATPKFGLTGGTLEWNNTTTTAAQAFQADINNTGTTLVTKPNAQLQVIPTTFAMSGGTWNIDIGLVSGVHNVLGADWFNANTTTGTASLTGGTLNINYLAGFTPNHDEVFRILRGGNGVTLNAGAITITGAGAGNWILQTVPITTSPLTANDAEIQLKYTGFGSGSGGGLGSSAVPEPSSIALVLFAGALLLTRRARSRTGA